MLGFENHIQNEVQITVIIPIFQEAKIIKNSLNSIYNILDNSDYRFEIIVADDGSTDHSDRIVSSLKTEFRNLRLVRHPVNMGRGFILEKAIKQSRGNIISYIDADLQICPEAIMRLARCIENGFDIAIGSKHHPQSELSYSRWRRVASLGYNKIAKFLLNVDIYDFQCGVKAFRRTIILELLKHLTCTRWSWDTELIFKALLSGYRLAEIPVIVKSTLDKKSSVHIISILNMGRHLFRLWFWSKTKIKPLTKNKLGSKLQ